MQTYGTMLMCMRVRYRVRALCEEKREAKYEKRHSD